jgi:hypothetical protein
MRRSKIPLTALLILFVLVDVIVGYRLWESGWPKQVGLVGSAHIVEHIEVTPVPFTGSDWLILGALILVHSFLCYAVWEAWRDGPFARPPSGPTQR